MSELDEPTPSPLRTRTIAVGGSSYDIAFDDAYGESLAEVFEPELSETLLAAVPPGSVALDVGANLGLTALLLSQVAGFVHAFEAVPSTHAILERNVAMAGVKNIRVHPYGLGAVPGLLTMTRDSNNRSGAFVGASEVPEGHTSEQAEIRTLDSLLAAFAEGGVGFMKIDVEGFELQVLRGSVELLRQYQPVVVLEMNHWCLNAFQRTSIPDFIEELRTHFPFLYAFDEATGQVADLHDPSATFGVMHEHIVRFRFMTVLGCYRRDQAVPALQASERRAATRAQVLETNRPSRSRIQRVAGRLGR